MTIPTPKLSPPTGSPAPIPTSTTTSSSPSSSQCNNSSCQNPTTTTCCSSTSPASPPTTKPRRRRIIRRSRKQRSPTPPPSPLLQSAISALPTAYDFEIPKTLTRLSSLPPSSHIALQMPEGLLMYASTIADIFLRFSDNVGSVAILGDVTYGACCVDDLGARELGCTLLIHYGHSCLVPVTKTVVKCFYVFVEIRVDVEHLVGCVCETVGEGTVVYVMGTVQFRTAITQTAHHLTSLHRPSHIPQAKPLSPGEVLGCTSPLLPSPPPTSNTIILFIADGRFHLEATLISNPDYPAYRYDPYSRTLTRERYDTPQMRRLRKEAIEKARTGRTFGIILGTLGRQGNPALVMRIRRRLRECGKRSVVVLFSEIYPDTLKEMGDDVDAWVQVACPRLSVDWGHYFDKPLLNSYELEVCLDEGEEGKEEEGVYPMDYYRGDGGVWANYHEGNKDRLIEGI